MEIRAAMVSRWCHSPRHPGQLSNIQRHFRVHNGKRWGKKTDIDHEPKNVVILETFEPCEHMKEDCWKVKKMMKNWQ
jgi:hypothetical protein